MVTDRTLVEDIGHGDVEALGRVYDRYGGYGLALARTILKDERDAEDAVQAAFIALWRSNGGLRTAGDQLLARILTLVHRECVDLGSDRGSSATVSARTADPASVR